MPLHQISVIPRDVTSSRVSGSGKAKDKDKQVCDELQAESGHELLPPGTRLARCAVHFPLGQLFGAIFISQMVFYSQTEKVL